MKVSTKPSKISDQNQGREDQTDDKQRQRHPQTDKSERAEAGHCNKLQLPLSSFQMMAPNQRLSQGLNKPLQLLQS